LPFTEVRDERWEGVVGGSGRLGGVVVDGGGEVAVTRHTL
jgi:hypothetical protein